MTKTEAVNALFEGKKLTHILFTNEEWIENKEGLLVDEKGMKLDRTIFWINRTSTKWSTGWFIYNLKQ